MSDYVIRGALVKDAAIIAHHRVAMFRDMGEVRSEEIATRLQQASASMLSRALEDGSYVGWLAIDRHEAVIGGVGVHIKPHLPRLSPDGRSVATSEVPLVVNVFTEPGWRRRGIARALMESVLAWAQLRTFDRVVLHASAAGRDLYAALGFLPTNEMRWSGKPPSA